MDSFSNVDVKRMISRFLNPWKFRTYLFFKLPAMWFSGVKLTVLTEEHIIISLPYQWSSKNPFKSIYFGVQSGAAELTTGIAVLLHAEYFGDISMLVTGFNAEFYKKADTQINFVCKDVSKAWHAVKMANESNEGVKIALISHGYNLEKELVSKFTIQWSIKKRNKH